MRVVRAQSVDNSCAYGNGASKISHCRFGYPMTGTYLEYLLTFNIR